MNISLQWIEAGYNHMNSHVKLEGAYQHWVIQIPLHNGSFLVLCISNQFQETGVVVAPNSDARPTKIVVRLGNPVALCTGFDFPLKQMRFLGKHVGFWIPVIIPESL